MAKVFVAERVHECVTWRSNCLAGYGIWPMRPSNQRYRRCGARRSMGGTMQIHRNMIAARVLGDPTISGDRTVFSASGVVGWCQFAGWPSRTARPAYGCLAAAPAPHDTARPVVAWM